MSAPEQADAGETIRQLRARVAELENQVSRFHDMTMQDFAGFLTTRAMRQIRAQYTPATMQEEKPINWGNDPDAIVEDDEPQVGRDYA